MNDWFATKILNKVIAKISSLINYTFCTDRGLAVLGLLIGLGGIYLAIKAEIRSDFIIESEYNRKKTEFNSILWPMHLDLARNEFVNLSEKDRIARYKDIADKLITQTGNLVLAKNDKCRSYMNVFLEHLVFIIAASKISGSDPSLDSFDNFYQKKSEMLDACDNLK
ncbi:MAG: hypothetical protein Q7S86_00380 [bacterium]|nr:hypothetical protein [bacterium]